MAVELTSSDVRVTLEGTEAQSNLTVVRSPVTVEVVNATASGGGGGVTSHNALTGLADDDHAQYLTAARGDARYDDRGQDSAATGLYAFSDFSRMTAGTIHNQGSSGSAIGDPRNWVDGRTAAGSSVDAFLEVAEVVSGVLRHRGTRLSAAAAMLLPGGAYGGTPAHGTAHTVTVGYVADTAGPGTDGPSFVRLGFLDGDNSNGYLGYLKAPTSTSNHEFIIVRDDLGTPTQIAGPFSVGRRLTTGDRWSFSHYGNTFAVYLNGSEVGRVTETTYAASTFNVTNIVLSSEDATNAPIGASLPGVPWHALSVGSPLEPVTPRAHAASHQDGGSDELALDASQTTTGQFNVARLGSGTPSAFTFLNGLGEWTADVPVYVPVKNTSGSTIAKGAPVYATGTVGDTSTIEIAPADADDSAKMPAIGLTESELDPNEFGYVVVVGTLRGVDTQGLAINAPLYVSTTAGQLTITKPTGTSELIQNIGRVIRANQNSGEILVLGPGRTNDVPNAIDAGKLTSGTVATARLGSGTADGTTFLRGDGTWAAPSGSGDVVGPASSVDGRVALFDGTTGKLLKQSAAALATIATSGSASDLTTGTVPSARLSLPLRRVAGSGISYSSGTDLFGTPPTNIQGNVTASALAAGRAWLTPCDIGGGPTLASIAFEVSASGLNAGQSVEIGCYARASTGLPTGTPLWTLSQTVGTTTGTYVVSTTNTLPEDGCWLAFLNPSTNAGTVTIYIYQPTGPYPLALRTLTNRPALISTTGISALPDATTYTVSNASAAGVWGASQQGVLFMLR